LASHDPLLGKGAVPPGIAVDDAEAAPEIALLHLYNSCAEAGIGCWWSGGRHRLPADRAA